MLGPMGLLWYRTPLYQAVLNGRKKIVFWCLKEKMSLPTTPQLHFMSKLLQFAHPEGISLDRFAVPKLVGRLQ